MFPGITVFNNNSTVLYTERYSLCVCIQSSPILFDKPISAYMNRKTGVNVVCAGSPSRILMVLLISLGMTTRPRSSACVKLHPKILKNPYAARVFRLSTKSTLALL